MEIRQSNASTGQFNTWPAPTKTPTESQAKTNGSGSTIKTENTSAYANTSTIQSLNLISAQTPKVDLAALWNNLLNSADSATEKSLMTTTISHIQGIKAYNQAVASAPAPAPTPTPTPTPAPAPTPAPTPTPTPTPSPTPSPSPGNGNGNGNGYGKTK